MKKLLLTLILSLSLNHSVLAQEVIFTAIGDQPYSGDEALKSLVTKINADSRSQLTIHVGDIKNGATTCSDERFLNVKKIFDTFHQPLIYTPGDNEWTDCHRISNGSYEPIERLEKLRQIFFRSNISFGKNPIKLERQGDISQTHKTFIENVRWQVSNVLFVTLHQVGSNNNLDHKIPGAISEFKQRNQANMAWLKDSFDLALKKNIAYIVLAMQSDTFDPRTPAESGFKEFHDELASMAKKFQKPILVIQGDSHEYKIDQAFTDSEKQTLGNVLRLIVPGASSVEAVQISINTKEIDTQKAFTFIKY